MRPLDHSELDPEEMSARAATFLATMQRRRRHFSDRDVPRGLIEAPRCIAGTAPSGAHLQPHVRRVQDPDLKRSIRQAAEAEEQRTYTERMPDAWREVLAPLGTDAIKPHLTDAPWVVVLFQQTKRVRGNGEIGPTYYATESCGIAAGLFIAAVHQMGLVTLTHTPSPMRFLGELLDRPDHERAMLVMPVGYPASDAMVPDIERKSLDDILIVR